MPLANYALAPLTVAVALVCRLALNPVMHQASPFMFFFLAILVSGWLGGLGPALMATFLSALLVNYFYMTSTGFLGFDSPEKAIENASFAIVGALVSLIVSRLRLSLEQAVKDITERKQAEEALKESRERLGGIVESAMDAILSVDEEQKIVLFNAAAEKMFRCPAAQALGASLDRFIPARFREVHREHIREFGQTGQTARAMGHLRPLSAVRADGEEFPIEASISQARVGGKKIFTAILRDITERKLAHDELERRVAERTAQLQESYQHLEELNRKLEVSNRELQDFAFVASHDLQEPLRKVMAFGDVLIGEFGESLGETGKDYLRRMQSAASRMQTLISDLLQFSRVTSKAQPFTRVDLGQVAGGVLADLEVQIREHGARVEVRELPALDADPLQMRQLLQNLIGNALKFARPEAPPEVRVYAEPDHDSAGKGAPGRRFRLCVADNGIGFDEKYLDRIFTVFQRLHGRGEYDGTGIGLAICRKIAERHGGSITAKSRPGEGSTFIVTLPQHQAAPRRSGNNES